MEGGADDGPDALEDDAADEDPRRREDAGQDGEEADGAQPLLAHLRLPAASGRARRLTS